MDSSAKIYIVTLEGQTFKLRFIPEESPTKQGINMQFVMQGKMQDVRDKQALADKIGVALQKKFGDIGIMIDYNDRNPYENVISFIVPMQSIASLLMKALKG